MADEDGCCGPLEPTPADLVEAMVLAAEHLSDAAVERLAVAYSAELAKRRPDTPL
jgi:hypothetical protein